MATNIPLPTTASATPTFTNNLFAAIDMGTNSFKLLIIHADPTTGRFLTLDRLKQPVVLGRDTPSTIISSASQLRAFEALRYFQLTLHSHHVSPSHSRLVATSSIREAANQSEFLNQIHQTLGFQIDVLSGYEEARLTYLGVLQFCPVYNKTVLTVDIGGGSTEFVIGKEGKVLLGISLKLGHVTLTQQFVKNNEIEKMVEYIRSVIKKSGLIEKVAEHGFDMVIGSSGTIRGIEKAIFFGYSRDLGDSMGLFDGYRRDWRFSREELRGLVERLCGEEGGMGEKVRRDGFFKRRSEFIVAGAVLLEEIFGMIGIEEMEVSGYALGEGVITEKLAEVFDGYVLNANARWRSVMRLATRFNNKKRMKSAALCAGIAKGIFEGLRKCNEVMADENELLVSLDDKDLEFVEAACLLHNIGIFTRKTGYHKQSYHIIMNGDHLHGYNAEDIKLIALLARYHRKKFPKPDHASLEGFTKEVKQKFRILCVITRLSAVLKQHHTLDIQGMELSNSHEGFKLVIKESKNQPLPSGIVQPLAADIEAELGKELEHFRAVLKQKLLVVILSSISEPSG